MTAAEAQALAEALVATAAVTEGADRYGLVGDRA